MILREGDTVRVYPRGDSQAGATAVVVLLSADQLSAALEFAEPPIFCKRLLDSGGQIGINRETCRVTLLLQRRTLEKSWIELTSGEPYEVAPALLEKVAQAKP